ncbi:hypothetical protein ANCDUO_22709, partial [Ancylostoma duodenale]
MWALTTFVAYAPTSSYDDEEIEACMELEKFYREDHTFYKPAVQQSKESRGLKSHQEATVLRDPRADTQRGVARAAGNYQLTSELAKRCREAIKEDLKERRAAVLAEAAEAEKSIRNASRDFAN